MILVKRISDFGLILKHGDGPKGFFEQIRQWARTICGQKLAQINIAQRDHFRIDNENMVELLGQFLFGLSQVINRVTNHPMLWRGDNFALHMATGGEFRVGQGLFDGHTIRVFQRVQNGRLLRLF